MPRRPAGEPLHVAFGSARFSAAHEWASIADLVRAAGGPEITVSQARPADFAAHLATVEADVVVPVMAPVDAAALAREPLSLVLQFGAGLEGVDLAAAQRHGVWVANMPGLNAPEVAEHAVMLLLALLRRLPEAAAGFEPGGWGGPPGRTLMGSVVCIVGLGAIGMAVAARLEPFGVELVGVRRDPSRGPAAMTVRGSEELGAAVAAADAVIVAAGHEAGRPPLIDAEVLGQMRGDAVLVNVGRGALVDEAALLSALDRNAIAGAGLDVFATEPTTAAETELVGHERVIATAHTAALTTAYFERGAEALAEALSALVEGGRPPHAVADLGRSGDGIDLTARSVTRLGASTQPF